MIQFLKQLWKALKQSTPDRNSDAACVLPNEKVARFIYQKADWSKQPPQKPKPKLFMPENYEGQWETSVCRISEISEQRILDIGNRARAPRQALGRTELMAHSVGETGLRTIPAPDSQNNYLEHAVIVGWPDEKEKQLELSQRLSLSSNLKLYS